MLTTNLIENELKQREELMQFQLRALDSLEVGTNSLPLKSKLAAVDVFAEKAIKHLTARGKILVWFSLICAIMAFLIAYLFLEKISQLPEFSYLENQQKNELRSWDNKLFVLIVISKLMSGTVFLAGMYFFASLSRSFLHEASVVFNRRHAIRFGRVHVYLKDGKVSHKKLMRAFGWNIEPRSAFLKLRPELVTKGLVSQLTEAMRAGSDVGVKAVESISKMSKKGQSDD